MNCHRSRGFALPTVLIASIIMLTVLVASIVSMSSVRNSLLGQYYNQLSQEAADAGLKYAQSCLDANGGIPQWSDTRPLIPGTSCAGTQLSGYTCPVTSTDWRCSVMINGNVKSSFRVSMPTLNSDGKAIDLSSLGIVSLIKTSDGSTWRTYSQSSKKKIIATGIVADNLVLNLDASNSKSYSGSGTAWTDLSGNNNNGVLMNGVSYSNTDGGSLIFDGIDDYVNLGTNTSLDTGDNVTIAAWVKPSVLSGRYVIYSNRNSNQTGSSQLEIGSGDSNFNTAYLTTPGIFAAKASNNSMIINNWQYVVYTRIGSLQSIYINGVNATKNVVDATFFNNNSHKTIGVGSLASPSYFKGQISTVQVYSRGLSSEEIKQNFNAIAGRYQIRNIQTLIVGGGGSGASSSYNVGGGGGGGGGGYIYTENLAISAGSYPVVVGNGSPTNANTASASSFANLIAAAGASGGGAPYNLGVGLNGAASGGGSASATTAAGSDLSGQYHNGALGFGTYGGTVTNGGGGGGAGGAGVAATNSGAGAGGAGVANSISGSSIIYASGGAGGVGSGGVAGASAAANTGRGGAGGGGNLAGGAGGSGVVIIRYLTGSYSAAGGTITTSGNYTIHTFNSNGTFTIN